MMLILRLVYCDVGFKAGIVMLILWLVYCDVDFKAGIL